MTGPSHDLKVDLEEPRKRHNREIIFTGGQCYIVVDGLQLFGVTALEMERVDAGNFGRLHVEYFDHAEGDIKDSSNDGETEGVFADEIVPKIAYSSRRHVKKVTVVIEMEPEEPNAEG